MIRTWLLIPAALAVPALLGAQTADTMEARPPAAGEIRALVTIGGAAEEQLRNAHLRGATAPVGFLVRSPSSLTPYRDAPGVALVAPETEFAWNSRIPFSLNDGAMWAGRGASATVMAGVEAEAGPLRLVLAPELVWSENRPFDELLPPQWTASERTSFLPPWQTAEHAVDLPFRFGERGWARLRPGQSSLTVRAGPVAVGAATENQWWGPGVRNAIVMTNNGAGVPHLFVRTERPLQTPLGALEARWMIGRLAGSGYPDTAALDAGRSLSAAALVLHPVGATNLSLGVARAVYAPEEEYTGALSHASDVFTRWRGSGNALGPDAFEQISSVFGRWVFPQDGAEVYAEWARHRLPRSLGDLLETPEHTQGYVLGAQWLRPVGAGEIRLQAEVANLEESPTYRTRSVGSFYASEAVPQGYTHGGQVIGAAIGPGSSTQWLAADWLRGEGQAGIFVGRVRWSNDAYYDNPATERITRNGRVVPRSLVHGHDVTVLAGLRGRLPIGGFHVEAEWTAGKRYNFMFQNNALPNWSNRDDAVDVFNHTLRLGISPRPSRRP